MVRVIFCVLIFVITIVGLSCGQKEQGNTHVSSDVKIENVGYTYLGQIKHNRIIINHDVDLKGNVCKIPVGKTLVFEGRVIKNGILIGNMTKIECKGEAFDKVTIKGTWDVPEISTNLFATLDYENSLRDVVALAHPKVKNRIVIEKGDYKVRAEKSSDVCVPICSNTDFILKGTIRLESNDFKHYYIIQAKGENINIEGNGTIIGDKHTHTGTEGEWGMGVNLNKAVNATVTRLTIKDCWGDCIYVGGNSRNVLIENCKLDHGRRQGISVTKANGVTIRNCMITNVGGTAPEYAIDIEPNSKDSVDNILVENVRVKECEGGVAVTRRTPQNGAKTPWIGNVTIKNCDVKCRKKYPVIIKRCEKIEINNCKLAAPDGLPPISIIYSGEAIVHNNSLNYYYDMLDIETNGLRELVGKGKKIPIDIRKTKKQSVKKNIEITRR